MKMSHNWKVSLVVISFFAVSTILLPGFTAKAMAEGQQNNDKAATAVVPAGEAGAAGAGAAGGAAATTGISVGTIAIGAVIVGGVAAAALAAGGGGGSTTSHH